MTMTDLYQADTLSLDLYSGSSLKQQFAVRHVDPLGHINPFPSQPGFAISP